MSSSDLLRQARQGNYGTKRTSSSEGGSELRSFPLSPEELASVQGKTLIHVKGHAKGGHYHIESLSIPETTNEPEGGKPPPRASKMFDAVQ